MLAAYVVFFIGAVSLFGSISIAVKIRKIKKWPVITAKITDRKVIPITVPIGPSVRARFEPYITYTYSVDGKEFKGHQIQPGTISYAEEKAKEYMDKLPSNISIHYNPVNPSEAYIFPGSYVWAILSFFGGIFALFFGLLLIVAKLQ